MSDQRFNTGNPIGSNSPLDRSDNTRNLDILENSRDLTEFPDRFGVPRKTRYGMEVEFAADQQWREENFNAMQSGELTNRAEAAASAAETAAGAAFINADVYPDVASGLAAVAVGEQFQVLAASGDEYIRYRHDAGPVAVEVGRYPSSSAVAQIPFLLRETKRLSDALNGYVLDADAEFIPSPNRILGSTPYFEFLVSDINSLYQDREGTVPVNAIGQRVRSLRDRSNSILMSQSELQPGIVVTVQEDENGVRYLHTDSVSAAIFAVGGPENIPVPMYLIAGVAPSTETPGAVDTASFFSASNRNFRLAPGNSFRGLATIVDPALGSTAASTAVGALSRLGLSTVIDGYIEPGFISTRQNGGEKFSVAAPAFTESFELASANIRLTCTAAVRNYGGIFVKAAVTESQRTQLADYMKMHLRIRELENLDYDIFGIAGQSNASGQGDFLLATVCPWSGGGEFTNGFIKPLAEPTRHYAVPGSNAGNFSDTGSAWSSFAKNYHELTGRRALIVGGAASGIGISTWAASTPYKTELAKKMLAAKAFVEKRGGSIGKIAMLHLGGEADAGGTPVKSTVKTNLMSLISSMRTLTGVSEMPAYLLSIDRTTNPAGDANYQIVREAIAEVASENSNVHLVMPYQDFVGQGRLEDTVHWNQGALNEAGAIAAASIAALL